MQMPELEPVLQVFLTQHWTLVGPGQWPATLKPWVVQSAVFWQVPDPSYHTTGRVSIVIWKQILGKSRDGVCTHRSAARLPNRPLLQRERHQSRCCEDSAGEIEKRVVELHFGNAEVSLPANVI